MISLKIFLFKKIFLLSTIFITTSLFVIIFVISFDLFKKLFRKKDHTNFVLVLKIPLLIVFNTLVVLDLIVFSFYIEEFFLLDIAIIYLIFSFLTTLLLSKHIKIFKK